MVGNKTSKSDEDQKEAAGAQHGNVRPASASAAGNPLSSGSSSSNRAAHSAAGNQAALQGLDLQGAGAVQPRAATAVPKPPPKIAWTAGSVEEKRRPTTKMAVLATEITEEMEPKIQQIFDEIQVIYKKHKDAKKNTRDAMDKQVENERDLIAPKQKYLIAATKLEVYPSINVRPGELGVEKEIKKAQKTKDGVDLSPEAAASLDQEAKNLEVIVLPKIEEGIRQRLVSKKPKEAWQKPLHEYCTEYGRHAISDSIVQGYEHGYQNSEIDRAALTKEWVECAAAKGYDLIVVIDKNIGEIIVTPENDPMGQDYHLATIYFGDKRFRKSEEIEIDGEDTAKETRVAFKHRETNKSYVQDASGIFVKRFVKRALNQFDNPEEGAAGVQIKADPRTRKDSRETWADIARQIPHMTSEEKYQEIRNHQRAKEAQGGSPFISFTTTDRPIFGSSGKLFESKQGVATIDLARIPQARVFDTHTPAAMERIHGINSPYPFMPYKEGDEAVERNSAARDAMRTRELVVAGDVPGEAIIDVSSGKTKYEKGPNGKFRKPLNQVE